MTLTNVSFAQNTPVRMPHRRTRAVAHALGPPRRRSIPPSARRLHASSRDRERSRFTNNRVRPKPSHAPISRAAPPRRQNDYYCEPTKTTVLKGGSHVTVPTEYKCGV